MNTSSAAKPLQDLIEERAVYSGACRVTATDTPLEMPSIECEATSLGSIVDNVELRQTDTFEQDALDTTRDRSLDYVHTVDGSDGTN